MTKKKEIMKQKKKTNTILLEVKHCVGEGKKYHAWRKVTEHFTLCDRCGAQVEVRYLKK